MSKICSKCGRELPLECFSKCKSRRDGLQPYCKECNKQYRAEHAEHLKQWRAEHAEAKKQHNKQWRADNAVAIKQYRTEYYSTIEGYARRIRNSNLQEDRKYGRIGADEDPLPTIEEYIHLLSQPDFYDGKQYPFNEMGLDRIDNAKPHTIDNVIPCSTAHNRQRGRRSFEEFCAKNRGLGVSPTS